MDYIAKKEGEDVKPEGGDTIVIRVCDSVWVLYSVFLLFRKVIMFTSVLKMILR